jgi:nucleoside-diphosphate-sugar epimerase
MVYVVGGQGYVGSRVVAYAASRGGQAEVVSRAGDQRQGVASTSWPSFLSGLAESDGPCDVVWLLDGAKHAEADRLAELLAKASATTHVVLVSTCTVYGDAHGRLCDEKAALDIVTGNARAKFVCETMLAESGISSCVLRLGALYGPDDRGVRADRVEKWVTQAAREGVVTVPEPAHWRGWLHRDQAARALYRAAVEEVEGTFNVASANYTFGATPAFTAAVAKILGADVTTLTGQPYDQHGRGRDRIHAAVPALRRALSY